MLKHGKLFTFPFKRFMTTSSQNVLEPLENRTLLRVSGHEASNFLQGLMTNDIEHLSSGPGSLYTMFLNSAGRVLYDSIIYKTSNDNNTYLLECDKQISPNLQKHLKIFRVRKKIDIKDVGDEMKIHALFDTSEIKSDNENPLPSQPLHESLSKFQSDFLIFKDPRLASLGLRILTNSDTDITKKLDNLSIIKSSECDRNYRWLRYSLGVGEGIQELPPGECFPLESNCDYLHGVSFHKGCYIGQELTARVHHTGVIRKRLMPVYFTKVPSKLPDEKIVHENVNLGKLKGVEKDVGLALLRFNKTLVFKEIKFGDGIGVTVKPKWWPIEAPKEKMNISKTH